MLEARLWQVLERLFTVEGSRCGQSALPPFHLLTVTPASTIILIIHYRSIRITGPSWLHHHAHSTENLNNMKFQK